MSNKNTSKTNPNQPMVYQIRLQGHLGQKWTEWFEGMSIDRQPNGDILLTGPIADQAVLHGLLRKVRDLGMPLLSVNPVDPISDTDSEAEV